MWHVIGNLIAAPIFAAIGAIGAIPLVMYWAVTRDRTDAEIVQALLVVAAVVFLAVLFTPKSKAGLFRGLFLSGLLLVAGGSLVLAGIWGGFQSSYAEAQGMEKLGSVIFGSALSSVPIIALAIGLIFVLLSLRRRKSVPATDQSS
ncbi:hypothetical protein [Yoonia sp. SDW83-1]|uniref:hypothetical protein n=1 Tax=Yoonia sp. SDW83-1 TaxID=3366945 RepID=UPI00398C541F